MSERTAPAARPRVVIVGAGFGGLSAALALKDAEVDITLVDQRNHHLFQPLLYQVATAGLSPGDIAAPIRAIVKRNRNTHVALARVEGVDTAAREVLLASGERLPYDQLILATGARHSYFGNDQWAEHAPGIKTLDDATDVRKRVLLAMERAENSADPAEIARLLTFVVIGGGPTGVEMAGAIAELCRHSVAMDFRRIMSGQERIVLVEAGPRILSSFPEDLSAKAVVSLTELGVTVRVDTRVEDVHAGGIIANGAELPAATVVWAAGVRASPAGEWLGVATDRAGRVLVGPHLEVAGLPTVFVIGDTAAVTAEGGQSVPGIAPAAKQMGWHVARVIMAEAAGKPAPPPFRYRDQGNLATIGRSHAVVDFGWLKMSGYGAWVLWSLAHIWFLIGFRNRFVVAANWLWNYVTFDRGTRLITGDIDLGPGVAAVELKLRTPVSMLNTPAIPATPRGT